MILDKDRSVEIYLQRKNKIIPPKQVEMDKVDKKYIATAMKNLESYGYTFSEDLINVLENVSTIDFVNWYKEIETIIIKLVGGKGTMIPMFPNFPEEVMEMEESKLYLYQLLHYLSLEEFIAEIERKKRYPLIDNPELTILNLGSEEDFLSIFTNLLKAKTSLSTADKDDILWYIHNVDIDNLLPSDIPNKETLTFLTMLLWDRNEFVNQLIPLYKTATDVLRLAVSLSGGDVSLADYPVFKSFRRRDRRILLELLENATNIEEDMLRHKLLWIRLGEKLHPAEYKQFAKVNIAFKKIRENKKINTFRSELERLFNEKDIINICKLLAKRPGEFGRDLDRVLRLANNKQEAFFIVNEFSKIVYAISTPILLQLISYFNNRNNSEITSRVFFPKGNISKAYGIENNLPKINEDVCNMICSVVKNALILNYANKDSLGKVYIDEDLKNYIVPTSQRNSSKALKTIARGSRLKIKETSNIIRCFIYWKEHLDRYDDVDLDLSAVLYDSNFNPISRVFYNSLRDISNGVVHSGDIRSAKKGASEYIDIDLNKLKKNNVKYVSVMVNSYSATPYSELPECFVGFMEREDMNSGEIYEPKTVVNKADLTTNTTQVLPMILDIDKSEIVWCDLAITNYSDINNIITNQSAIFYSVQSMLNTVKPNMYDLVYYNSIARADSIVDNKEEADTIFSINEGITPYDVDITLSDLL